VSATCRYCGKSIVWGLSITGAKIPLDDRAEVYEYNQIQPDGTPVFVPTSQRGVEPTPGAPVIRQYMTTHFATCPGATKASNDAKAKREAQK
jgi:hypothetical protein